MQLIALNIWGIVYNRAICLLEERPVAWDDHQCVIFATPTDSTYISFLVVSCLGDLPSNSLGKNLLFIELRLLQVLGAGHFEPRFIYMEDIHFKFKWLVSIQSQNFFFSLGWDKAFHCQFSYWTVERILSLCENLGNSIKFLMESWLSDSFGTELLGYFMKLVFLRSEGLSLILNGRRYHHINLIGLIRHHCSSCNLDQVIDNVLFFMHRKRRRWARKTCKLVRVFLDWR
jgi:hypothetical protein